MCSECRRYIGHHPSCPYADEPAPVSIGKCEICDKDVMTGEEMVQDGDYLYHYDCLSELTTRDLLDLFDVSVKIAECE